MSTENMFRELAGDEPVVEGLTSPAELDHVSFSSVAAEELADVGGTRVVDMVQHAEKAEEIADGLNHLADKAEELVAEDQAYAHTGESLEGLHREFGLWMRMDNLSYKAASFESEQDTVSRAKGLAKDCRRIALSAQGHRDSILNFSPEGAIMQFLRQDNITLNRSVDTLTKAIGKLNMLSNDFKQGLVIHHGSLDRLMQRNNRPLKDFTKELGVDIAWVNKAYSFIDSKYKEMLEAAVAGEQVSAVDFGNIATDPSSLLGNRTLSAVPKYSNDSKFNKAAAMLSGRAGGLMALSIGLSGAPAVAALATGVVITTGLYALVKDGSYVVSNVSHTDLTGTVKDLIGLRDMARTFVKYDTDKLDKALSKLKTENKEVHASIVKEVSRLHVALEGIYDHARFMLLQTAAVIEYAVNVVHAADQEHKGATLTDQLV